MNRLALSRVAPDLISGWTRFCCFDERFPLSIAYPQDIANPTMTWFDPSNAVWLVADFDDWIVARQDLSLMSSGRGGGFRGGAEMANAILSDPRQLTNALKRFAGGPFKVVGWYQVGMSGIECPRTLGSPNGPQDGVRILDSSGGLWHFGKPDAADDNTFMQMLASVRWLSAAWSRALRDARSERLPPQY